MEELKDNWRQPYMLFYQKYVPNLTLEEERASYRKAIVGLPVTKPLFGIVDWLKGLRASGKFKMIILSSDFPDTLLPEIERFGLGGVFDDVVANAHDKTKDTADLIAKHDLKLEETIIIGDSNHEIEVGKNAGIKTCAVTWGFCSEKILQESNPDYLVNDLEELKTVFLA